MKQKLILCLAMLCAGGCVEIAPGGGLVDVALRPMDVGQEIDGQTVVVGLEAEALTDDAFVPRLLVSFISSDDNGEAWLTCGDAALFSLHITDSDGVWVEEEMDTVDWSIADAMCLDDRTVLAALRIQSEFHLLRGAVREVQLRYTGPLRGALGVQLESLDAEMVDDRNEMGFVSGLPMAFPHLHPDESN